jgi:hypothetical protein
MAQPQPPAELTAQEARRVTQTARHLLGGVAGRERREEHARAALVRGHADGGDGDIAHAWILHLARDQPGQYALDFGLDALVAGLRHYCSVLATSTREKHSI